MVDLAKVNKIMETDAYKNAYCIYNALRERDRFRLEPVIGGELYGTIVFDKNVLEPKIGSLCELAYACKERGYSYEIGCYFQNKIYSNLDNVRADICKFESLLKVYDKEAFPEEVKLVSQILQNLNSFEKMCETYELYKD